MADDFNIIAITPEKPRKDEIEWVSELLTLPESPVKRVHIRHPDIPLRPILSKLAPELRKFVSIHNDIGMLEEYPEIGFHFNSAVPYRKLTGKRVLSISCHSWKEVADAPEVDYVTLSPIFDSVSKTNYFANPELLNGHLETSKNVIALGGITPRNLSRLSNFAGAAMIGSLNVPLYGLPEVLRSLNKQIKNLCSSL